VPAGLVSSEASLLVVQITVLLLPLHTGVPLSSFLINTPHSGWQSGLSSRALASKHEALNSNPSIIKK
jgi:hypothetical protein